MKTKRKTPTMQVKKHRNARRQERLRKAKRKRLEKEDATVYSSIWPRHIARQVAKANMHRIGFHKVNKNFSSKWKQYV